MITVFDDPAVALNWLFKNSFCWKCKFLPDCKRKNARKDLDSPFCFEDSKGHAQFVKEYKNSASIAVEQVEEPLQSWSDNPDE